jgi:DNA-binding PadR family transcriptional regulator
MLGGLTVAKIGEFELLVVLAILRQHKAPFANQVRRDLVSNARRSVTRGALYRTLDRLKDKGLIEWQIEPETSAERGGLPMRRLKVTDKGIDTVRESRAVLLDFFDGLGAVLD